MITGRYVDQHVSLIRKELVTLTQDSQLAVVLNQLLYWVQRVKDFDLFLEEERTCPSEENPSLNHGWIYKTADELIEETLLTVSRPTMRKYLKMLAEEGWIEEKRNPDRKWDRTSHFRLNLKRIHDELLSLGYGLSGFEKGLFDEIADSEENNLTSKLRNLTSKEENLTCKENLTGENTSDSAKLNNLTSNVENLTDEEKNLTCKLNNLTPKLENFPSKEKNLTPKLKNLTAYTYTENTQKNKNKEHTQDTRGCEKNFSDSNEAEANDSIAQEMVDLWEQHIVQKLFPKNWQGIIQLTENRKSQLESLFSFHFQNDIRQWERFCLRVKVIPFLMGEGPNGWHATLDWILKDRNLAKVLEGNYDDPNRMENESSHETMFSGLDPNQPHVSTNPEKEAILASIKDPIWREWCTRLSQGMYLNELRFSHDPLSAFQLKEIANARFLECEDDRLVWIGSSDPAVLKAIETLRLQISWVYANEYPKARAIRTRLDSCPYPVLPQPLTQGDHHHD